MKVFISWSGEHSRKLGEAIRDWLPGVIQLVQPYFTPSDIEKGARWANDISKELSESQVGILCVTRENIHSDWVLFEAGALSKSLDKSHVCPILFGISNTDLAGPLKQFQTTQFEKGDMSRLLGVINSRLGENKLPQKTLDLVFEKWWPDLEQRINSILETVALPEGPLRSDRELLEEILQLTRHTSKSSDRSHIAAGAIQELFENYISLHNEQVAEEGGYQDTLDSMQRMHKALTYIARKYKGTSNEMDGLIESIRNLSYTSKSTEKAEDDEDIPF